jgi:hypothetical protein
MPAKALNGSEKFLRLLERNVKQILLSKDASRAEKVQAIATGAKLLAIRHKIEVGDDAGFFS